MRCSSENNFKSAAIYKQFHADDKLYFSFKLNDNFVSNLLQIFDFGWRTFIMANNVYI